jgi:GMP synthase (glutamine-hydrolysing)
MKPDLRNIKILLLQARHPDDQARHGERRSFASRAGLDVENITPYDLLSETPNLKEVQKYDVLMIGGSGDFYVSKENLPGFPAVLALLNDVVSTGHPTFASCFGFQLLVNALGGEVAYRPDIMEVGTYQLRLSEAGAADELFTSLPPSFAAQLGHKDRAESLPENVLNLALSENADYQALRVPDKPIWATQFHPELSKADNLKRFHIYMEGYADMMSPVEVQLVLNRFADSPETEDLIPKFLGLVFG